MCPTDTTPDPRDMQRAPLSQSIPEDGGGGTPASGGPPDIAHRPGLPEHPQRMDADLEDGDLERVEHGSADTPPRRP